MNTKIQDQKTQLQKANIEFNAGNYELAIELYEKAALSIPVLANSLQINIQIADLRLGNSPRQFKNSLVDNFSLIKPPSLDNYYFEKVIASGLFDVHYYAINYQHLITAETNLLEHYLHYGIEKSLNPSADFDTAHYLKSNPDVAQAGINPFIHYVCNGKAEGREAIAKPFISKYTVSPVEYIPRLAKDINPIAKAVRAICFYLPQFHAIPENDKWWGEGFTEWTNVKPATPQFAGHYQPHVPHEDIGYYNLLNRDAQAKQIELAKQYGIEGFCYYLYWFSGQRLLEKPLDNMLADPTLDFPFCVCWANENWSRRWDGLDQDLLMVQNYSDEDDIAFISNIAKYLRDPRYITINGRPLLLVYRPNLFPNMKATTKRWRDWCKTNGIGEIYLAYPQSFECVNPDEYDFDAAIEFPPNNSNPPAITSFVEPVVEDFKSTVYDWRAFVERSDTYIDQGYKLFRSATPSWDNTARKKNKGTVFHNSCPKLFQKYLVNAFGEAIYSHSNPDERLVFINAWNEWAEGAHLEPDEKYGYAWLQAVRNAHETIEKKNKKILIVSHDAHPHGAQILCLNFAKDFNQKLHFDVDLLVLGDGRLIPKYKKYARVHQLDLKKISSTQVQKIINDIRAKGVDIAIVNTTVSGNITPYLKNAGFNIVSLIHELPSVLTNYNLLEQAKAIALNADKIVFPAHQVQDGFESFIGAPLKQAVIRPQGIYLPSLLREGATKESLYLQVRKDLGLPIEAKIIMCAGYADYRKGFDYFVQISLQVMQKVPNTYALWVGHLDAPFTEAALKAAESQGKRNRFILTGLVDDPRKYYIAADVYALTSREDPFPSVVMESLDALTPVVAFKDAGGFENLLQRNCGVLVQKHDVNAFTKAILELLTTPTLANDLAANGKAIIENEFSFYHYLFDLLEFAKNPIPKVSAIVPNYNYAKYLISRLESIIHQTFPLYDLIILDDVSTDNSTEIISQFLKTCQIPHQLVINSSNSGSVFKQWKKGAELARGDYLWIAEADDLAENKFIEKLIPAFNDPEVEIAFCQSKQIDQDGKLLANDYLAYTRDIGNYWNDSYVINGIIEIQRAMCVKNIIPNVSGTLIKKSSLINAFFNLGTKLAEYKVAGDWLIYLDIIKKGKISFNPESLNLHRRHTNSITKVNDHFYEIKTIHEQVLEEFHISEEMKVSIDQYSKTLEGYFINNLPKVYSNLLDRDLSYYSSSSNTGDHQEGEISTCDRATIGKENWIFIYKGTNDYLGSYLTEPNEDISTKWVDLFMERSNQLKKQSIKFVQLIIPNKASIINDRLPYQFEGKKITGTLFKIITKNKNCDVLIPLEKMRDVRIKNSLFRKNDSHLTLAGSALLTELILEKLGLNSSDITEKINTKEINHIGDLGKRFEDQIAEIFHAPVTDSGLLNREKIDILQEINGIGFNGSKQIFKNSSPVFDKTIMIFGNSFFEKLPGWGMTPIFASLFKSLHFIWSPDIDYKLIEAEKPDIVICQTCERFLNRLPIN